MQFNLLIPGAIFIPSVASALTLASARRNQIQRYLAFIASLLAWGCSLALLIQVAATGTQVYQVTIWPAPIGTVFVADLFSSLFGFMTTSVMMAGMIYTIHCKDKSITYPAFVPLFLLMQVGLTGAFYTGDIFSFFVFMELMVLASVSLVAIADDRFGLEAAIKYLFISGMGSLLLLLGIASLYASFGTLNLADMAQQMQALDGERPFLARSAAVMLISAFLLKSAVFPFHFWQPDFHTTAPTPVSAMLSSVIVKIGIYGIIRIMTLLFTEEAATIQQILLILGIVGIFYGSLGALRTYNGKRMLAYSTIGQVGFILVGIGWGTPLALAAAIVYAFNHAFIKSALLMLMGAVSSHMKPKSADFAMIGGMGRMMNPAIGVMWVLGGMALAGLPPLNGFISKLGIIEAGVQSNQWLPLFLAVGAGVLTLTYMFRTWQHVFQQSTHAEGVSVKEKGDGLLAPAMLIGACILLGLYARPLVDLAFLAVQEIGNPDIYITAVNLFGG